MNRGEMPTGVYPYAAPQSQYPGHPMPVAGSSRNPAEAVPPERSTAARYECSYCHKGFTRPSSLKIHINTHTGERPFTCPHPGCGRSFSVQSNMRRHARVHERGSDSQADVADEELDEGNFPRPAMTKRAASASADAVGLLQSPLGAILSIAYFTTYVLSSLLIERLTHTLAARRIFIYSTMQCKHISIPLL
ncbi:uncharacterized protein B0H18DRAFT_868928 [Fomitopsis serialis]|uniref:uncharacterized protein n=1 Tax=Fomitopsis serialis TaxID=139415 RepID=UPI0020083BCD|nr:uncharacterized protein B0H18DRAFT_868928 [Neoantrodia serialis]KAH9935295.1 hypothetical protein B0H18DRAFT_868928 [Neoantrodia serialis]